MDHVQSSFLIFSDTNINIRLSSKRPTGGKRDIIIQYTLHLFTLYKHNTCRSYYEIKITALSKYYILKKMYSINSV